MVSAASSDSVVVFALGDLRFALGAQIVERVVRAVEVSPLPNAPEGYLGVINLHGRVIPVVDIRPRFGLPPREVDVDDHFVIAKVGDRQLAVVVDAAVDVVSPDGCAVTMSMETLAGVGGVAGVMMQGSDLVPIQDLAAFLPPDPGRTVELKLVA